MKSTFCLILLTLFAFNANAAQVRLADIICGATQRVEEKGYTKYLGKVDDGDGRLVDKYQYVSTGKIVHNYRINCLKIKSDGVVHDLVVNLDSKTKVKSAALKQVKKTEARFPELRRKQDMAKQYSSFNTSNTFCDCSGALLNCTGVVQYNHEASEVDLLSLEFSDVQTCKSAAIRVMNLKELQ